MHGLVSSSRPVGHVEILGDADTAGAGAGFDRQAAALRNDQLAGPNVIPRSWSLLVKVLLGKYRYPPDRQPGAMEKVITQAELLADTWALDDAA